MNEKKGIAIITGEGEEWKNLPWYYGVSYDRFKYPGFEVVWLPIPLNTIVSLGRAALRWMKSAGGYYTVVDRMCLREYRRGFREGKESTTTLI